MPREHAALPLSHGQSQYILERLITEGRVTPGEVARYLTDIQNEIGQLEARLRALRDANEPAHHVVPAREHREKKLSRRGRAASAGKALGGTYGGLIRRVPRSEQPHYQAIKARDGIRAAIAALQGRKRA
jgi:hypothetical protein